MTRWGALFLVLFPILTYAKPIHVAFLGPSNNHPVLIRVHEFMRVVARDLDIELEFISSDWNHKRSIEQAREVVQRKNPPDFIITGNLKNTARDIIPIAEKAGVPVFLLQNGFVEDKVKAIMGAPREKYKFWIGELLMDGDSQGYLLAKTLIEKALKVSGKSRVNIVALAGDRVSHGSVTKVRGLKKAVAEFGDKVELLQIMYGNFTSERADEALRGLFQRYDDIDVVWTINSNSALVAAKTAESFGKEAGSIQIGGSFWLPQIVEPTREGTLSCTMSGSVFLGGWALVLIHDYHHGKDFISESLINPGYVVDKANVDESVELFTISNLDEVDFKRFSRLHNPDLSQYQFTVEAMKAAFSK